jgi:hypothetical protein
MNKLILFTLFLLLLPTQVFATEFIPYTGTVQPMTPVICVLDNSAGSDSMNVTQSAVNVWSNMLNHLTHSNNWNMHVILIDKMHFTDCNISFNYNIVASDPITIAGQDGKSRHAIIMGLTSCNPFIYGHMFCEIDINLLNNTPKTIFSTTQHEFGHALGIGHRVGNTAHDMFRAFMSDDLMFPSSKTFAHLTNDDVLAIIELYGVSGFNNAIPPSLPYIIDHPTHFPCKLGNSTVVRDCII